MGNKQDNAQIIREALEAARVSLTMLEESLDSILNDEAGTAIESKADKEIKAKIPAATKTSTKSTKTTKPAKEVEEEDEVDEEEENSDKEILEGKSDAELIALLKDAGVKGIKLKAGKSAHVKQALDAIEKGVFTLDEVEEEPSDADEEEEEEGYTEEQVIEAFSLDEMDLGKLREFAEFHEIDLPKTKKVKYTMDAIVAHILENPDDFVDQGEDEEEDEEEHDAPENYSLMDVDDLRELAIDRELVTAKAAAKKNKKTLIELLEDDDDASSDEEDEAEDEDDGEDEEDVITEEMQEEQDAIEKEIRQKLKTKKLTTAKIKSFLEKYYVGDPECKNNCKNCSAEELVECYIEIQQKHVNDEGVREDAGSAYLRNGKGYCCGHILEETTKGKLFCPICGSNYEND